MKKSTFAALVVVLATAVGSLTAAWLYIRRREKELDEYEQLLFSEDLEDEDLDEEPAEAPAAEPAPAVEEPAAEEPKE